MSKYVLNRMLPLALVVLAAATAPAPAFAQVRMELGMGPFDVRFAPDGPPPMRREFRPPQPGPDVVWVGGYWDRDGDRWAWREGRWDRGERRGDRWVTPVYRRERGGYRYEPGHWSSHRLVEGDHYHHMRDEYHRR
ncbi:MAG: hypothetical protein P4L36_07920 [Holophaga sp.]|nr:hypothetical protein [Holophaga sp.]